MKGSEVTFSQLIILFHLDTQKKYKHGKFYIIARVLTVFFFFTAFLLRM